MFVTFKDLGTYKKMKFRMTFDPFPVLPAQVPRFLEQYQRLLNQRRRENCCHQALARGNVSHA